MWPSLPFIILLVAGLVPPDTGKAPPATKPTITAAPFKITQSTRVQRDGGDWEAGLPVEFWFEGNYGASIPFIRVESVYRFDPLAFFKDGRLVRLEEAVRWAHEQRESERWQGLLADEEDGDFYSAMLFPKLEVTEERDVITATTGPVTAIIKPFSGEVPRGAAQRYAQMYKLSAAENAMGRNVVPGWFVSEQIADLLATRNILPERLEITTRTPSGSATAEVTITVDRLYRNESRSLQRAADRLEKATTQPATKPAAAK